VGTRYHAAWWQKYWIEDLAGLTVQCGSASEYPFIESGRTEENLVFKTLSQSGETADRLAALGMAKELGLSGTTLAFVTYIQYLV